MAIYVSGDKSATHVAVQELGDEISSTSPFLRLPAELRLQIYSYLLLVPAKRASARGGLASNPDYHEYEKSSVVADSEEEYVVQMRNWQRGQRPQAKRRSEYKIRAGPFRAQCMDATYGAMNPLALHPAIMGVNHQIHAETTALLYGTFKFDFDTNVEAAIPFLSDLTPLARQAIRRVSIVKRALPYSKEFDAAEWARMCAYIARNLTLVQLDLGIVAGKPIVGWETYAPFARDEFQTISRQDEMRWVNELVEIKGLSNINVRACIEHCPPPCSSMMNFFVCFSASVEHGFKEYLNALMIPAIAA